MAHQPKAYKKFVATAATATLVATAIVPAASAATDFKDVSKTYQDAVNYLVANGIAKGTSETTFGTTNNITRGDAAVMIANALKLDTAKAPDAGFKDVNARVAGAVNAIVEAKIASGKSDTKFDPSANITRQEMAKMLANAYKLTAKENANFKDVNNNWIGYVSALKEAGITLGKTDTTFAPTENLTRGEFALFVFRAEGAPVGVVENFTLTATSVKTLEVKFNAAVKDTSKATFVVKKGNITNNFSKVEWNEAKTAATLTMNTNLTKGEYSVTVNGLDLDAKEATKTVKVENQAVTKVEFVGDKLVLDSKVVDGKLVEQNTSASIGVKLLDQYGSDVTKTKSSEIKFSSSKGTVTPTGNKLVLSLTGDTFKKEEKVVVTGINQSNGVFASATLTVSPAAYVSEIAFGDVTYGGTLKDAPEVYTSNLKDFYIPVNLKDQYGNTISDKAVATASLLSLHSNVDVEKFDNDKDGNLVAWLKPATSQIAGNASVTFVSTLNGSRATKTFNVNAVASIKDFSLQFPELVVAKDGKVDVAFTAVDQYGKAVTNVATLNSFISKIGVSGDSNLKATDFNFEYDYKTEKVKLTVNTSEATEGTAYVHLVDVNAGVIQSSFKVSKAANPVLVAGTFELPTKAVVGSNSAVIDTYYNMEVQDQYGRDFYDAVDFTFESSNKDVATVSAVDDEGLVHIDPKTAGTTTITIGLSDGKGGTVEGSAYTFTYTVVKASEVKTFSVLDIDTVHGSADAKYKRDLTVVGQLADGSDVVLNNKSIKSVTSTSSAVTVSKTAAGNYFVTAAPQAPSSKDVTASVVVTIEGAEGPEVFTVPVKVSYATPVAATIAADPAKVSNGVTYVEAADMALEYFVVKDQYGVKKTDEAKTYVVTNASNKDIVLENGKILNAKAGDTFVLTAITSTGKSANFKVVVTK